MGTIDLIAGAMQIFGCNSGMWRLVYQCYLTGLIKSIIIRSFNPLIRDPININQLSETPQDHQQTRLDQPNNLLNIVRTLELKNSFSIEILILVIFLISLQAAQEKLLLPV